jgi:hypothetical protein
MYPGIVAVRHGRPLLAVAQSAHWTTRPNDTGGPVSAAISAAPQAACSPAALCPGSRGNRAGGRQLRGWTVKDKHPMA